MIMLVGS